MTNDIFAGYTIRFDQRIELLFESFHHSNVDRSLRHSKTIQNHIWKYKINKELNYDFDKTILPLDQKYLEIKGL